MRCIIFTCLLAMVSIGHTSFATNDKKEGEKSSSTKKDEKKDTAKGGSGEMDKKRYACMDRGKC